MIFSLDFFEKLAAERHIKMPDHSITQDIIDPLVWKARKKISVVWRLLLVTTCCTTINGIPKLT
jgi:hypothetical protein